MLRKTKLFIFCGLASLGFLKADGQPLTLRLNQDQKITHTSGIEFNLYVEASEGCARQIQEESGPLTPEQTFMFQHVFNQLCLERPAISGNIQVLTETTVQTVEPDNYRISIESKPTKIYLEEKLFNNFRFNYDSTEPEKNSTNIPIPFDFKEFDQSLAKNTDISASVAKDGTLISLENLNQLLSDLLNKEHAEKASSLSQFKIASYLTSLRLPQTPFKVGESRQQPLMTLPEELNDQIPQECRPLLALLDQKITLIEQDKETATFQIELPAEQIQPFSLPDIPYTLTFEGHLLKAKIRIDLATGLLKDGDSTTDFSLIFHDREKLPSSSQKELPPELVIRIENTMSIRS